ncbi:hypothetical protein AB3M93_18785 [Novosphingobium panipatense]|uniref:hypothetical protein n=1 Tax=Novosphingobium panipatense TaxID=428991 RepID=UPI0039A0564C
MSIIRIKRYLVATLFLPIAITAADSCKSNIDPRISVSHVSGIYPLVKGNTYLEYGAQKALSLGFQNIEVYLNPTVCLTRKKPSVNEGIYQNAKTNKKETWCNNRIYKDGNPDYNLLEEFSTLKLLASNNLHYAYLLNLPIKTLFITIDPVQYKNSAYSILIPAKSPSGSVTKFNQSQIDNLYREIYDLAVYLRSNFEKSSRTFVLLSGNEMDWILLGGASQPEADPDPVAIENAVLYWNTVQSAIEDAKIKTQNSKAEIYHGCEVNLLLKSMEGRPTATNNVVPRTHCDLYGYSSYDTTLPSQGFSRSKFVEAIKYLKQKAPDSKIFGKDNVFISEIGQPERDYPPFVYNKNAEARNIDVLIEQISTSLRLKLPYVNIWTLYDNECTHFATKSDDFRTSGCPGFWMVKPSGTLSDTYQMIAGSFPNLRQ